MSNRDHVRFHHMLDAALAAISHLSNRSRGDLDSDRLLLNGVVRELEIIGEAASQVAQDTRKQFPQLPWKEMVGLRNRLIHAYFDVNIDTIWLVITEALPPLISQLNQIIEEFPDSQPPMT